jgi:CheY-like chemotaxis protein
MAMPARVLIVEDNPDVMFVLLAAVDSQQCEFIGVEEGSSVLQTAQAQLPDLIIMDVQLPGITGLDACKLIRQTPELEHTKILGISGHVSAKDIEQGMFDEFMEKPFEVSVLLKAMARMLGWESAQASEDDAEIVLPDQDAEKPVELTFPEERRS